MLPVFNPRKPFALFNPLFMSWFYVALVGYFILGLVFVLDKLILTKSVGKPVVYAFYSTIFLFGSFFAVPFGVKLLSIENLVLAGVSALFFGFAMWTQFVAVKEGEASHINPFNGAMITIFTFFLSYHFLAERLEMVHVVGVVILVVASLMLSLEKSRKNSGIHIGFFWAVVSGFFYGASHVAVKYLFDTTGDFLSVLVWSKGFVGFVGLFFLLFPSVRRAISFKKKRKKAKTLSKRHAGAIVIVTKALSLVAVIMIQYAIAIGSVTLVGALSGLQYAFMFVLILLLTKFLPKIFKEYFTKQELKVQTIAIILVIIGSTFFVL